MSQKSSSAGRIPPEKWDNYTNSNQFSSTSNSSVFLPLLFLVALIAGALYLLYKLAVWIF